MSRRLVIVLGPTAVGKTDFSIDLALKYGSPVISCDSRQIYKEMSIGTAVPTKEQLSRVQHYFIQTKSVTETYTAGQYELDALDLIEKLFSQGHETLVMAGGSMFYIDAVCKGLDSLPDVVPEIRQELMSRLETEGLESLTKQLEILDIESFNEIDISNPRRVVRALEVCLSTGKPFSSFKTRSVVKRDFEIEKIGLNRPREELYDRINKRVLAMIDEGLEEEARNVIQYRNNQALQTVGYKEMFDYLDGKTSLNEAISLIQQHTRNYAKRQLTWWRKDTSINWREV